jgi:aldose 1-epimerase
MLDGEAIEVPVNDGPNSLHGGGQGFDKKLWTVTAVEQRPTASVRLRLVSPDGDQGYPGTVTATATYSLDESNVLAVDYRATTDRATVVNLSNHAYWNLAGEGEPEGAMGHLLTIPADHYCPTGATAIPTGAFQPVQGTAFDFRNPMAVGAHVRDGSDDQIRFGRGYDHNWVISRSVAPAPRLVARVEHPESGRVLEVHSDQPGLQFYSGNFLDGTVRGKSGRLYRQGDAIVLEPQMFPDTPNRPAFGSIRLGPGETYRNRIEFRFSGLPG